MRVASAAQATARARPLLFCTALPDARPSIVTLPIQHCYGASITGGLAPVGMLAKRPVDLRRNHCFTAFSAVFSANKSAMEPANHLEQLGNQAYGKSGRD